MTGHPKPKYFYGYVIVAASFTVMCVMWGTLYSFGVFIESLLKEFGWARGETSLAFSLSVIVVGLLSGLIGRLTASRGPRAVVTVCGIFVGCGFLLLSRVQMLWQLYLFYGLFVGIGVSGATIPTASTVARWFVKRLGLMTGVMMAGLGVGTLVFPLLINRLTALYDWRMAYAVIGVIALVTLVVAAQFLIFEPEKKGLRPYGERENIVKGAFTDGFTLPQAVHTGQFWILCTVWFIYCLSIGAVVAHIVLHGIGLGYSTTQAALILSITGAFSTIGRITIGSVGDRIGFRRALTFGYALMTLDLFWLLIARDLWALYLFSALFGFSYGGIAALSSPVTAEQFGLKAHGVILGVMMIASEAGEALSPVVTGYVFDITNSYYPTFFVWALCALVGAVLLFLMKPVATK